MNHDEQYRREDERKVLRGAVGQIAAELAAEGWGLPGRLSILHGPHDHLVESDLAGGGDAESVATLLAGLHELAVSPAGGPVIDVLVAELVPRPVRAWLLVFESVTTPGDPVPERVTLAVDRTGYAYAALTTGQGTVPAVCVVEFSPDEPIGAWIPAYRCLSELASHPSGGRGQR